MCRARELLGCHGRYALAVAVIIVALTLLSVATFNRFEKHVDRVHSLLPRISALILIAMGLAYLLEWI